MEDKYERILKYCEKEVDRIIKMYRKEKDDPPLPWMFPPIAGVHIISSISVNFNLIFLNFAFIVDNRYIDIFR